MLCLATTLWGQSSTQQLVIGPVVFDAQNRHDEDLQRLVRNACCAAFDECGCSNLLVSLKHRYKGKLPPEEIQELKETESEMLANFFEAQNFESLAAEEQKKMQYLRSKCFTRYLFFGKLVHDPSYEGREYSLEIHTLDMENWKHAIPKTVFSFSADEIEDYLTVRTRVLQYLNEKKDKRFCTPKEYSPRFSGTVKIWDTYPEFVDAAVRSVTDPNTAPSQGNETPAVETPSTKQTAPLTENPTREDLDKVIRQLIRYERYYPDNKNIQKAKQDYIKRPASKQHYFQQKLIVYTEIFSEFKREDITPGNQYAQEILDVLIDTLYYLIPTIENPEQAEKLRQMRNFYSKLKNPGN